MVESTVNRRESRGFASSRQEERMGAEHWGWRYREDSNGKGLPFEIPGAVYCSPKIITETRSAPEIQIPSNNL